MNTGTRASRVLAICVLLPFAVLVAARTVAASVDDAPEIPEVLTLEWCLERARDANPRLEQALASAAAAGQRVVPAGALEDPRFSYEASNLPIGSFDFKSTPMSGQQFGLTQKFPFPGLLSSRKHAARRAAEVSELHVDDQRLVLDGMVESAWAELGFAQRALGITERNIALLRQLAATAESRYRVGSGLQGDVLRAQVELTALLDERLRRTEAIARGEALLVALLDLPATVELPLVDEAALTASEPPLAPLLEALEDRNPRIGAARKRVEEARFRIRAAEIEGLPDVDLGFRYRLREPVVGDPVSGDDFISAGVSVRLPVDRSKYAARVAEQRALLRRAEAELRGERAELVAQTRRSHAELVRAFSQEVLLRTGLVPQARQSLAASRSAYEVGRIEFLSLLDSQVRLLGAELRLARARADKRLAFASLEVAAGEKLR